MSAVASLHVNLGGCGVGAGEGAGVSSPPDGMVGGMFAVIGPFAPPPQPGAQPPTLWGSEGHLRELLGQARLHDYYVPVSIEITDSPWSEGQSNPKEKKRRQHKTLCGLPIQYPQGCGQYSNECNGYGQGSSTEEEPAK